MTFDDLNLNSALKKSLTERGFFNPTPIQREVFSLIMSGRDVAGVAQTGTGKTLAYLLPLLRLWKFNKDSIPRILILVPTRELVLQVVAEIELLSTYTTLRVAGVYGGTNINTQAIMLREGHDVIVATPGRLLDLNLNGALKLTLIRKLVIDEFDEMMNLGFRPQLNSILDILPERRQNLLFSATMNPDAEKLIDTFFNKPERIIVAAHGTPLEQIKQYAYILPNFYTKANLLVKLLEDHENFTKILIFAGSKKLADFLHEIVEAKFPETIGVIHSNKSQNYRIRNVEGFQDGTFRALIATDIIARGLDIKEVSHVINFDLPDEAPDYIHRIGRTGRADKDGIAISFIKESEEELQLDIEELMKMKIEMLELPEDLEISKETIEAERERMGGDKHYMSSPSMKSKGAYQEKSLKNQKVNLGNSYKRKLKEKFKSVTKRSGKQKKTK